MYTQVGKRCYTLALKNGDRVWQIDAELSKGSTVNVSLMTSEEFTEYVYRSGHEDRLGFPVFAAVDVSERTISFYPIPDDKYQVRVLVQRGFVNNNHGIRNFVLAEP